MSSVLSSIQQIAPHLIANRHYLSQEIVKIHTKLHNPVLNAVLGSGSVGLFIILFSYYRTRKNNKSSGALKLKNALITKETKQRQSKLNADFRFWKRLLNILRICVPHIFSREFGMLAVQSLLLITRTLLSLRISAAEGLFVKNLVENNFRGMCGTIAAFAIVGIPAAFVNSGLKLIDSQLSSAFRRNLTLFCHKLYMADRNYYKASQSKVGTGGAAGVRLDNADQRIAEDISLFSNAITDLYSYSFKPLLDVIIYTRAVAKTMGFKSQFCLYGYFLLSSMVLRKIMPPIGMLTARGQELEGNFRTMHGRIITYAEEIAFLEGGQRELSLLNTSISETIDHFEYFSIRKFFQGIVDSYAVKYMASTVGLTVYAVPAWFAIQDPNSVRLSEAETASGYVRSMRLLMTTSTAIGDLIMISKKISQLVGYTTRVAELLERVDIAHEPMHEKAVAELFETRKSIAKSEGYTLPDTCGVVTDHALASSEWVHADSKPVSGEMFGPLAFSATRETAMTPRSWRFGYLKPGSGLDIVLDHVSIFSPDNRLLAGDICLRICPGTSVIVTGPNGCGKSSLFRVLCGLWPLTSGTIQRPPPGCLVFVPQRPYLVSGTLRDQLVYPLSVEHTLIQRGWPLSRLDEELLAQLKAVGLSILVERDSLGLESHHYDWTDVLSGGEKQRLGLCRMFFQKPVFAVLDEATSAINVDQQEPLYQRCKDLGITCLSIAHRLELKKFHNYLFEYDGDGHGGFRMVQCQSGDA